MKNRYNIIIVGGGIVGTAVAMAILQIKEVSLLLLETENELAKHQTGNNSGVIHSGLYYKPGSLKAKNCVAGRDSLYQFCEENNIKHQRCGKLVVAVSRDEIPNLDELERRGKANGLEGMKRISKEEIKEHEPFVNGIEGLYVPQTGIIDYKQVTRAYAEKVKQRGGEISLNEKFLKCKNSSDELIIESNKGEYKTKIFVNCGGLYSDQIALKCGIKPDVKIIPFRGEYYKLKKEKEHFVKNLIYPVPDPKFPFLGVHFTRMIEGGIEAGPNAVLALKREGYKKNDFSVFDIGGLLSYPGFWKMAAKYYRMGFEEFTRSFSKKLFVKALQRLIPQIHENDVLEAGAGVRAQALDRNGKLLDDFSIFETKNMVHILNAPSPAATASISIGKTIAEKVINKL
jgi:L-2-hydroxyglutarate oxidase